MFRFLAIDTTTEVCSVAFGSAEKNLARTSAKANSHAKVVLQLIDEVLCEAKTSLKELDAIALTVGPGSFTGIRIGLSVAQGLAYGAHLPIVRLTSLELLAQQAVQEATPCSTVDFICPALDARMNEIYWQIFSLDNLGGLTPLGAPEIGSAGNLNDQIAGLEGGIVGVGHGWSVEGVDRNTRAISDMQPNAANMLGLAQERFARGEHVTAFELEPLYLRNEITWQKRKRIRS